MYSKVFLNLKNIIDCYMYNKILNSKRMFMLQINIGDNHL